MEVLSRTKVRLSLLAVLPPSPERGSVGFFGVGTFFRTPRGCYSGHCIGITGLEAPQKVRVSFQDVIQARFRTLCRIWQRLSPFCTVGGNLIWRRGLRRRYLARRNTHQTVNFVLWNKHPWADLYGFDLRGIYTLFQRPSGYAHFPS